MPQVHHKSHPLKLTQLVRTSDELVHAAWCGPDEYPYGLLRDRVVYVDVVCDQHVPWEGMTCIDSAAITCLGCLTSGYT